MRDGDSLGPGGLGGDQRERHCGKGRAQPTGHSAGPVAPEQGAQGQAGNKECVTRSPPPLLLAERN